jgi:hypothetical protein
MKRRIFSKYLYVALSVVMLGWVIITLYAEKSGPSRRWSLGTSSGKKALIVFDPDPFYNLDEQICLSFGRALAEQDLNVTIATVAATDSVGQNSYDVLVYCANTYNWRPDWSIMSYIKEHQASTSSVPIVAITLGAGSTEASQKHFEKIIVNNGGKILESYSLWLWRPNNEQKIREPNVDVAVAMAYDWGSQIGKKIN